MINFSIITVVGVILFIYHVTSNDQNIPDPIIRKGKDLCNKSVNLYEDITSPKLTTLNYGKPLTCWYKFHSNRGNSQQEWILQIRFKKFKFGKLLNSTDCDGGYMQIIDGNAKTNLSNRKDQGIFCGEIEQMQTFISETSFVKILFHTDNFTDQTYYNFETRAEQEFNLYHRFGKHPELYPNRRGYVVVGTYCERIFKDCRLQTCYVQSPAYPGIYPRGMHCVYHLNTKLPFIKLYMENQDFNIDGQRCENIISCPMRPVSTGIENCPNDYIRIYDGKNTSAVEIGTFCGMGKFPYSIIGTSQDLFVEFVTSRAGPFLNTGFHFNVGSWPGRTETAGIRNGSCSWIMTDSDLKSSSSPEGIFLSVVHWYPPNTVCTYLIRGSEDHIVRIYFPSLRINKIQSPIVPFPGDCGESLTIYDSSWSDDSKIVKTFCDTFSKAVEKFDYVSTGPALFVRFESKTGSYSGSSLYYWAHYDFFNNTKFGDPVSGTACDEEFFSWKQERGWFRSPINTLIYKKKDFYFDSDTIRCRYKFFTDQRIFARIILTVKLIAFKVPPSGILCKSCLEDKVDKIIIWEEQASTAAGYNNKTIIRAKRTATNAHHDNRTNYNNNVNVNNNNNYNINSNNNNNNSNNTVNYYYYNNFNNNVGSSMTIPPMSTWSILDEHEYSAISQKKVISRTICLCENRTDPVTIVSASDNINLELIVDSNHTSASYFKHDSSLFEAEYKFVHEPICGSTVFKDAHEGQMQFPSYQTMAFINMPRTVHCIWDIRVKRNRDISLHFDRIQFASNDCADGRLEIYLPSMPSKPFIRVCGHNVSVLNSQLVKLSDLDSAFKSDPYRYVQLHFVGVTVPSKTLLKVSWTELYHVRANRTVGGPDGDDSGTNRMERLRATNNDCNFIFRLLCHCDENEDSSWSNDQEIDQSNSFAINRLFSFCYSNTASAREPSSPYELLITAIIRVGGIFIFISVFIIIGRHMYSRCFL